MAHLMNELPDVKVRLRAEPADEFSARVLGALAPGAFEASAPEREGGCSCVQPAPGQPKPYDCDAVYLRAREGASADEIADTQERLNEAVGGLAIGRFVVTPGA